jgi:hypothetical protein
VSASDIGHRTPQIRIIGPRERETAAVLPRPVISVAGLAVAVLACATVGCGARGADAAASCVGPRPSLSDRSVLPGQQVTFVVEWLHKGCHDNPAAEPEVALVDVPVEVVQGGSHTRVGTMSGRGPHFTGTLTFMVPGTLRPGDATVVLGGDAAGTSLPIVVAPSG